MSEPYLGEIRMFGFAFAPTGWQECNGQILAISQYAALFSLIGNSYGGNGQTNFALPDLRSRVPIHAGTGLGLSSYTPGQAGGAESVVLTTAQMAPHTHTLNANTGGGEESPAGNFPGNDSLPIKIYAPSSNVVMNTGMVNANAGSQSHPNIQPYCCVTFLIALEGLYPTRN